MSPQWLQYQFFTADPGKVVLCHIHPLFKDIPPQNWQQQPQYNFLSGQFAYHCCCHWGESLTKIHFICQQHFQHGTIPNPPHHNEQYGPNMVYQKVRSGKAWNWIVIARNMVICWLVNRMGIQQPECLINKLIFKSVVDWIRNSIWYGPGIFLIKDFLTHHYLLLNVPCAFACILIFCSDQFQLLLNRLGRWTHIAVRLILIAMANISQRSKHWNKYI